MSRRAQGCCWCSCSNSPGSRVRRMKTLHLLLWGRKAHRRAGSRKVLTSAGVRPGREAWSLLRAQVLLRSDRAPAGGTARSPLSRGSQSSLSMQSHPWLSGNPSGHLDIRTCHQGNRHLALMAERTEIFFLLTRKDVWADTPASSSDSVSLNIRTGTDLGRIGPSSLFYR